MEVFPLVNNFDETEWKPEIGTFLMNPDARARFRRQIDAFLVSDKYRGLMVDFETSRKRRSPVTSRSWRTFRRSSRQGVEVVRQRSGAGSRF